MKHCNLIQAENGLYKAEGDVEPEAIIHTASQILLDRLIDGEALCSAPATKQFLQMALADSDEEHFGVIFLSSQHHVLDFEVLFNGTINQSSAHPRVVVKKALQHNAGAVILAHNHPSDVVEPSIADKHITEQLKEALTLIDIRVLDHIIVGRAETYSFAENGLI